MNQIHIPFEGRDIALDLPEMWQVAGELKPDSLSRLEDIPRALTEALEHPIGCKPLGSKDLSHKRIVIAVDDVSRPTPTRLFFDHLLEYLFSHGAGKEDILVIAALGVHRGMTSDEMRQKLGGKNAEGIRWINHNYKDAGEQVTLGVTARGTPVLLNRHLKDADLIACVGLIEPHALLGFGGGLKMILPGLAHEKTIARNHMQGVSPEKFNYIGMAESPMRLDLEEAALMLRKDIFIVNVILNRDLEICRFLCGDPVRAHREGARIVEAVNAKKITERADVAIVTSHPMNADLRQGIKSIANIEESVKPGGLILAFLECNNGIGDVNVPHRTFPLGHRFFRLILMLAGKKRLLWFVDTFGKGMGVEERFLSHFSLQVARKNRIFIYSKNLPDSTGRRLGLFRQFRDFNTMLRAAARCAPRKAKVYIYPHGGITYPIIMPLPTARRDRAKRISR